MDLIESGKNSRGNDNSAGEISQEASITYACEGSAKDVLHRSRDGGGDDDDQNGGEQVGQERDDRSEESADRVRPKNCLLYTSDAADERSSVDLGGRRII